VPERPRIVDGVPHLTVYVPDLDPTAAMDQEYEIRVVDGWLRLGPVARFSIRSRARPSEPYEAALKTRALVLDDDALRPQSASTSDQGAWFTPPLRARFKAGELDTRRCGLYSPYGCGAIELALLAHGDAMVGAAGGERAPMPAACIGVRQSPGRTLRMIFTGQKAWDRRIAAAEWVDDADAGDWSRVAAGCSALIASVGRQETERFEGEKAKRESWKRRRAPCGQTQGTGGCK
jgi:hypothetical protein